MKAIMNFIAGVVLSVAIGFYLYRDQLKAAARQMRGIKE